MERFDPLDVLDRAGIPFPPISVIREDVDWALSRPEEYPPPWTMVGFASLESVSDTLDWAASAFKPGTPNSLRDSAKRNAVKQAMGFSRWLLEGKRVYVLDPTTAHLLRQTDLPSLPFRDLVLPHAAFFLSVPGGVEPFAGEGSAEGVLFHIEQTEDPTVDREITYVLPGEDKEGRPATASIAVSVSPDSLIPDLAERGFEGFPPSNAAQSMRELVRLVFGFVLYLMSEHPRLEPIPAVKRPEIQTRNPKKRRAQEKRIAQQRHLGYVYVGRTTREEQEDVADLLNEVHQSRTGALLEHPVWVRGHYRNQAHGPGHQLRKIIWIKPHRRGPDMADSVRIRAARVQPARLREES
jgi:hypothetical protein